jgi:hypothetical protein
VTSATTAAAGSYSVAASATNGQDTTKAGTGSAPYSVSAPAPPPPSATLTMSVATDKASYTGNSTAQISATVLAGTAAASGASVSFKITRPDGTSTSSTATTSTSGKATTSVRLRPKDPKGTYQVSATATLNGQTASSTTSFTVN